MNDLSPDAADDILAGLGLDDGVSRAKQPHQVPMSQEFVKVDIHAIKIPEDRHRKFFDHTGDHKSIKGLADSISRLGLINPITVTRDLVLVAGERRLRAHLHLARTLPQFNQISIQFVDELSADERRAIEVEENLKRADFSWQENETALADLVEIRRRMGWTKAKTAESIGYDKSTISNRLKVAQAIKEGNPEVLAAKSAREAERIFHPD